jgi:hypothetical protein
LPTTSGCLIDNVYYFAFKFDDNQNKPAEFVISDNYFFLVEKTKNNASDCREIMNTAPHPEPNALAALAESLRYLRAEACRFGLYEVVELLDRALVLVEPGGAE